MPNLCISNRAKELYPVFALDALPSVGRSSTISPPDEYLPLSDGHPWPHTHRRLHRAPSSSEASSHLAGGSRSGWPKRGWIYRPLHPRAGNRTAYSTFHRYSQGNSTRLRRSDLSRALVSYRNAYIHQSRRTFYSSTPWFFHGTKRGRS